MATRPETQRGNTGIFKQVCLSANIETVAVHQKYILQQNSKQDLSDKIKYTQSSQYANKNNFFFSVYCIVDSHLMQSTKNLEMLTAGKKNCEW